MANLEEKVKAFLGDEKKVEAIAGDQKFLDEVSGGTVTTEAIAEEFKNVGLTLSAGEADEIKKTAGKALDTPLEKLGEIETKNVSGGAWTPESDIPLIGASVGAVGGLGCWIAGTVCRSKAAEAQKAGDTAKSEKLTKAAKGLNIATGACIGLSVAGLAIPKGLQVAWRIKAANELGKKSDV